MAGKKENGGHNWTEIDRIVDGLPPPRTNSVSPLDIERMAKEVEKQQTKGKD